MEDDGRMGSTHIMAEEYACFAFLFQWPANQRQMKGKAKITGNQAVGSGL